MTKEEILILKIYKQNDKVSTSLEINDGIDEETAFKMLDLFIEQLKKEKPLIN